MEELLKLIQDAIFQVTGKRGVTYDTDFVQDLELNSFDIMNIISLLEEWLNISIPTREVWQLRQVRDAIAYAEKKGAGRS